MARGLLLIGLCLSFPPIQQRVIEARRTATLQSATGTADHAPQHDWRRAGGGTTRAVSNAHRPLAEQLAIATATVDPLASAHHLPCFPEGSERGPSLLIPPRPPLRI